MTTTLKVGQRFEITIRRPWTAEDKTKHVEIERLECEVTYSDKFRNDYKVLRSMELIDACPNYSLSSSGGMTVAGITHMTKFQSLKILN